MNIDALNEIETIESRLILELSNNGDTQEYQGTTTRTTTTSLSTTNNNDQFYEENKAIIEQLSVQLKNTLVFEQQGNKFVNKNLHFIDAETPINTQEVIIFLCLSI